MIAPTADASSPGLRARLGWRAERRPEPGFAHVLAAGAGAFAVLAVNALVVEITGDDATAPGVLLNLVLAAIALFAGLQLTGPIKSAATTVLVFAVPLVWLFAFVGDGSGGTGSLRGIYLLSAATYALFYLLGWTRGRNVLLALALLVASAWIVFEVQGGNESVPFQSTLESQSTVDNPLGSSSNDDFNTFDGNDINTFEESDDSTTETGVVGLLLGLGYLAVAASLDRKKLAGAATPFIAVGAFYALSGGITLGVDTGDAWLAGLFIALTGAAVGLVGGLGENRRGSTWIGVIFAVIGLLIIVIDINPNHAWGYAGLFALVALGLSALTWWIAPKLNEAPDGDIEARVEGEPTITA
jgi:hypothetical protein